MLSNEQEVIDSQNDEEVVEELEDEIVQEDEPSEDEVEQLRKSKEELEKKVATLEAQKNHFKKKATNPKETKETQGFSQSDLLALVRNNVHEDDIEDISDFAKLKGLTIKEAISNPIVKSIIAEKEESRKTAEATSVKATRRSQNGQTDEELLSNASKGILPESEAEIARLNRLRWGQK